MKKYIKPEITFALLMEECALCVASPTVDHSATHGSAEQYGNPEYVNEGYGQPTYKVEDNTDEDDEYLDAMSKKSNLWDDF